MFKKIGTKKIYNMFKINDSNSVLWWNRFVRIKDDKENIIPFVQCIKSLSILTYGSNKIGSSTHKTHAKACLDGGVLSSSRNQDISVMINNDDHVSATAKSVFVE